MKIKKSSWHYRINILLGEDLCKIESHRSLAGYVMYTLSNICIVTAAAVFIALVAVTSAAILTVILASLGILAQHLIHDDTVYGITTCILLGIPVLISLMSLMYTVGRIISGAWFLIHEQFVIVILPKFFIKVDFE